MISIFKKIAQKIGLQSPQPSSALYDFMTQSSDKEKKDFLGSVVTRASEDQQRVVDAAQQARQSNS